jgi:hypothetical protein
MVKSMDWKGMRGMSVRLLEERTGEGLERGTGGARGSAWTTKRASVPG